MIENIILRIESICKQKGKKTQVMEKLDHIKSKLQLSKIYHKIVKMSQKLREDVCSTYNRPVSRAESHGCGCRKSQRWVEPRERAGDEWGGKGWMSLTNLGVDGDRQKKV